MKRRELKKKDKNPLGKTAAIGIFGMSAMQNSFFRTENVQADFIPERNANKDEIFSERFSSENMLDIFNYLNTSL
jgi:hypothetical protein